MVKHQPRMDDVVGVARVEREEILLGEGESRAPALQSQEVAA